MKNKIENKKNPLEGTNIPRHKDLRDLIGRFEDVDELSRIQGADWNLEMAALSEMVCSRNPGKSPALLFENIKDYPENFRVLSGAANSFKRLAIVLGFPEPSSEMDLVQCYRDRMKEEFELIPPKIVESGPVLENIDRDDEVNLYKFPIPLIHEFDGGRYIGTDDVVIMKDPDTGSNIRIKVTDGKIVFPLSAKGKHVDVQGRFTKLEYTELQAKNWKIHLAKEQGITLNFEDFNISPEDLVEYRINGTGATIYTYGCK